MSLETAAVQHNEQAKALQAIRECREQIRQGHAATWLNAAYAANHGVTLAQIAEAAGVSVDTVRKELRRVSGRA